MRIDLHSKAVLYLSLDEEGDSGTIMYTTDLHLL